MSGIYDFAVLRTDDPAVCALAALPQETAQDYRQRLRQAWKTNPMLRQHLALYARREACGKLRYSGPLADEARSVLRSILQRKAI
ncbi:MAG: hypothetical protein N2690_01510 [Rhodocyclaceae bacterium]|nr:hypothetical protein [Rhodocyclaceae bacterium]